MSIIYQKETGGLYAQPGRTVSTFPSGLCRVDQTFICVTQDAATHRSTLAAGSEVPGDRAPSIDPLIIHPAPQEVNRGDGFTEFKVSAYGQTTSAGSGSTLTLSNIQLLPVPKYGNAGIISPVPTGTYITADNRTYAISAYLPIYAEFWQITGFVIVPFGQSIDISQIEYDPKLNEPISFYETQGNPRSFTQHSANVYAVSFLNGSSAVFLSAPIMTVNSYTNFGGFAEVNVTITRTIATITIE